MASTIPSLVSSNLIRKSNIIALSQPCIKPGANNYKPAIILNNLRWLCSTPPPEYTPKTPPEFPGPGQETTIPSVPIELPDNRPGHEIDPGSTPDEEIGPPQPEPVPLPPDSPVPPLDPPVGPDTLPPPIGPDIIPPPDRKTPDMPHVPPWPVDPPTGPGIFPPPERLPPGPGRWPEDTPGPNVVF